MKTKLAETLPVAGWVRLALRAPLWLYRAHLGWLLGDQFLLLTHRGRKTGLTRQTVLEVIRYDPATATYVVGSGWGGQSDWYLNIQRDPNVRVRSGGARRPARAEILSAQAAERELHRYIRRHPLRARILSQLITGQPFDGTQGAIRRLASTVPLVARRPRCALAQARPSASHGATAVLSGEAKQGSTLAP